MNNPYGITPPRIDLIELTYWNTAVRRSIEDYRARTTQPSGIDYARRTAASKKSQRHRARRKEQNR